MTGRAKLKSKYLLMGHNARLFWVAVVSIALRYGTLLLAVLTLSKFFSNETIDTLSRQVNTPFAYTVAIIAGVIILFLCTLFTAALRLGEQFVFFTRASGGNGRFSLLFRFLTPKKSLKALALYGKTGILKTAWLLYYMSPCALCLSIIFYIYTYAHITQTVLLIFSAGFSVLFSISLFMWRITSFRYSAAPYYMCLNPSLTPKKAIKKSILHTDGSLRESMILESSFAGWILSCIFIIPVFYVLPYTRLSKAVFVTECVNSEAYSKDPEAFAVNYLSLDNDC